MLLPKHLSIFQKKTSATGTDSAEHDKKGEFRNILFQKFSENAARPYSVRYVIANAFFNFPKNQVQLAQIYGGKGDIRKYFIP